MTRLAVFCDGTWNSNDRPGYETNVYRLFGAVKDGAVAPDGVVQRSHYEKGVGTADGKKGLAKLVDKVAGGALGWGLTRNIEDCYRWLIQTYTPGDEIYIFGFSRGAYTARSLAGMIRSGGIPRSVEAIPHVVSWYKDRSKITEPSTDRSAAFRWSVSPDVVTGDEEVEWRKKNGKPAGHRLFIEYQGIWDTVGALGVPGVLGPFSKLLNTRYRFHDHRLSRSTRAGRHAISVDEDRKMYRPTLWENLPSLNEKATGTPYRQIWFPGDHGVVGGSGKKRGLSNHTLKWIAEGAIDAGLHVDPSALATAGEPDFQDALTNRPKIDFPLLNGPRGPVTDPTDLADATLDRLAFGDARGRKYDPKPLKNLKVELASVLEARRNPIA